MSVESCGFVGSWAQEPGAARIVTLGRGATLRTFTRPGVFGVLYGQLIAGDAELVEAIDELLDRHRADHLVNLPGCCSVALIADTTVTLLADPVGQFPLYLSEKGATLWFGSDAADIAARVGTHSIPFRSPPR